MKLAIMYHGCTMHEKIVLLGFALIFIGMLVIIIGTSLGEKGKTGTGFAFGGFIGPIPFGWASEKPWLYLVVAISVIMLLFFLLSGRVLH